MVGLGRGHAADQRHPIHHPGQVGKDLADLQARDRSRDRLELAPNVRRRRGLGVERVQMRRPAGQPDQNAIAHRNGDTASIASLGPKSEQVIHAQDQKSEHAGPQHIAPAGSGTVHGFA